MSEHDATLDSSPSLKSKVHPLTARINQRVGCGNSQLVTFVVAGFMLLCDGQEMLVMSLVNTRLKDVWKLSASAEGTLGSCVFGGVLIGSVIR